MPVIGVLMKEGYPVSNGAEISSKCPWGDHTWPWKGECQYSGAGPPRQDEKCARAQTRVNVTCLGTTESFVMTVGKVVNERRSDTKSGYRSRQRSYTAHWNVWAVSSSKWKVTDRYSAANGNEMRELEMALRQLRLGRSWTDGPCGEESGFNACRTQRWLRNGII